MRIEIATTKDIEAIASVLQAAFAEFESLYTPAAFQATTPTADQLRKRWEEGPVWVPVEGADIVGTVAAVLKNSGLYIRSMAVHPAARGKQIASQLLQEVESFAMDRHQKRLFLSTTPFLTAAIHVYQCFGLQRSAEGPHDLFRTPLFTTEKDCQKEAMNQMSTTISLGDISIRTEVQPGDLGYVTHMHGRLYHQEYRYGLQFESYVAKGLCEFYEKYNPERNRIWACEHKDRMIGFLLLMDRGEAAQLRYFLIEPEYRGIGLGAKLLNLYIDFLRECGYQASYLWTTHELDTAAFLYKRLGFTLTEEKESNAFGKPLKEQRYELMLS